MERHVVTARSNWIEKVEECGLSFHSNENGTPYWDESVEYVFEQSEVDEIKQATSDCHKMALAAVKHVIENNLYAKFQIPEYFIPLIVRSWEDKEPLLLGRFDFSYNGETPPKLLEYNADTPTGLVEAAVVQVSYWNSIYETTTSQVKGYSDIHAQLVEAFKNLRINNKIRSVYEPLNFTCISNNEEEYVTTDYLRSCAIDSGFATEFTDIGDIGWNGSIFVNAKNKSIYNLLKFYAWEFIVNEEFGKNIAIDTNETVWINPPYAMILSSKALLPILWELFPEHPNLLPAYFELNPALGDSYVEKPIYGRCGENVKVITPRGGIENQGLYHSFPVIYQEFAPLPMLHGNFPVIGSWVVDNQPAGIGILESNTIITDKDARFVPHCII